MKLKSLTAFGLAIPFVEAFAHSTKERKVSDAIVVRVETEDGSVGYGEGLPRPYVTGEDRPFVFKVLQEHYWAQLQGKDVPAITGQADLKTLDALLGAPALPVGVKASNAARCAVETALIDAGLRSQNMNLSSILPAKRESVTYHGVVTASSPESAAKLAKKMKLIGLSQLKVKIGLGDDYERVKAVAAVMGTAPLRLDANANQSLEDALKTIDLLKEFPIASIEAPIIPGDHQALKSYTDACPWDVVVDENLLTPNDAKALAEAGACTVFNVRLSKCGGFYPSLQMIEIASKYGIKLQIGAQVGETAILSAAARHLNLAQEEVLYSEGSFGPLLLTEDVSKERVSFGHRGLGPTIPGPGSGITVLEERIHKYTQDKMECTS